MALMKMLFFGGGKSAENRRVEDEVKERYQKAIQTKNLLNFFSYSTRSNSNRTSFFFSSSSNGFRMLAFYYYESFQCK
jgi:hypothetical protein